MTRDRWAELRARLALKGRLGQVAERLYRGATVPKIARDLGIKDATVRTYLSRLYAHLGVRTRREFYIRLTQILDAEDPSIRRSRSEA